MTSMIAHAQRHWCAAASVYVLSSHRDAMIGIGPGAQPHLAFVDLHQTAVARTSEAGTNDKRF
jgi:hypothetical protein